jgi:hypothetical protein
VQIFTAASGVPYTAVMHVIAATYPTDMFINHRVEGNIQLRTAPGFIEFPRTNAQASFYVDSN